MNLDDLAKKGYDAATVLDYISEKHAKLARKISKGIFLGYNASQILSVLTNGKSDKSFNPVGSSAQEIARKNEKRHERKAYGAAGIAAASLLGIPALSRLGIRKGLTGVATALPTSSDPETGPLKGTISEKQKSSSPLSRESILRQADQVKAKESLASQMTDFIKKHRDKGFSADATVRILKKAKAYAPVIEEGEAIGAPIEKYVADIFSEKKSSPKISKDDVLQNLNQLKNIISGLRNK